MTRHDLTWPDLKRPTYLLPNPSTCLWHLIGVMRKLFFFPTFFFNCIFKVYPAYASSKLCKFIWKWFENKGWTHACCRALVKSMRCKVGRCFCKVQSRKMFCWLATWFLLNWRNFAQCTCNRRGLQLVAAKHRCTNVNLRSKFDPACSASLQFEFTINFSIKKM